MKHNLIFLITLFSFIKCTYGQNCVVSSQNGDIVYIAIDNLLRVAVNEYSCKDYYLRTDNGSIIKDMTDCSYLIKPERLGVANISIYLKSNNRKISSTTCLVKETPFPVAFVASSSGGKIKKTVLQVQTGIEARLPGTGLQTNYKVCNYTITVYHNQKAIYSESFNGNIFANEVVEKLKSVTADDRVLFSNMSYISVDKEHKPLGPIEFVIE